jgi:hypothetical protein
MFLGKRIQGQTNQNGKAREIRPRNTQPRNTLNTRKKKSWQEYLCRKIGYPSSAGPNCLPKPATRWCLNRGPLSRMVVAEKEKAGLPAYRTNPRMTKRTRGVSAAEFQLVFQRRQVFHEVHEFLGGHCPLEVSGHQRQLLLSAAGDVALFVACDNSANGFERQFVGGLADD